MQAEQLFTGGTVRTGPPGAQSSGALAVAGGRVLALGEEAAGLPRSRHRGDRPGRGRAAAVVR